MTTQRGLSGASVLGSHLGITVPTVVRRSAVQTSAAEGLSVAVPAIADTALAASIPVPDNLESQIPEPTQNTPAQQEAEGGHEVAPSKAESNVLRIKKQGRAAAASKSAYRVGTQKNPYERNDGTRTQKLTFTGPWGLKREIERFCLDHDVGRSEWIVETLRKAMEREKRASERQQHTG